MATELILSAVWVVLGLVLLERSSDAFVDGSAMLARRFKVSPFVIGMVVIGFGTSAPELCVSLMAGLGNRANLSLGNAYGSCVFNVAAILGVSAVIFPLVVKRRAVMFAGPALAAISLLSWFLLADGVVSRLDALLLLAVFAGFFPFYCWYNRDRAVPQPEETASPVRIPLAATKLLLGLVVLVGSSQLLVYGACDLARAMGVSELMIGLTVVAVGTSLPELAAAIQSARRGHTEFVIGNIIGSNLFNMLAVVGIACLFNGAQGFSAHVTGRDLPAIFLVSLTLALFGRRGRVSRLSGAIWIGFFVLYTVLTLWQEIP